MRTVISCDGTAIAYERYGQGPALVLVGGGPALAELTGALAEQFSVYRFDRRGHGASGDTAPYALAREVEDVEAVIEEAGGSAFLVGLPSCGPLALAAARRLPGVTRVAVHGLSAGGVSIPALIFGARHRDGLATVLAEFFSHRSS